MMSAVFYVLLIFISINLVYGYDNLYPTCVDTEEEAKRFRTRQNFVFADNKPRFISSDALNITSARRNQYCIWYFRYLIYSLKISFEEFNLTDGIGCPTEYLAFKFNGDIRKDLKFCGTSYPKVLYLDQYYIKIIYKFNPDIFLPGKGFRLRIEESSALCETNQQLNVGNTPLYITSPAYPASEGNYGREIDCSWEFNATDEKEVILLEFLLFDPKILKYSETAYDKSICYINGLEVQGNKKYINLCDVEYNKLIIKTTNSTVSIRFRKKSYDSHRNVFIIRYYSVPKYDYGCTGQTDSKTLTAYRGRSQVVNVIGTSGKICSWNIEAENPSDVIIYELLSYATKTYNCYLRLRITEENNQVNDSLWPFTCIEKSVKYYRSSTGKIKIDIVDKSQYYEHYGGLSFSFYSIPRDVLVDTVMVITSIPSYIWIPGLSSQTRKDVIQSAILKSGFSQKCVQIKGLMTNLSGVENLYDYINVYDGYNDYVNKIDAACGMKFDSVSGSGTSILIKMRPNNINAGIWIKAEATATCVLNSNLKDLTVGNIAKVIESPGYPQHFVCHQSLYWQIRTESDNKVISLSTDPHLITNTNCINRLQIYDGSDSRGDVISSWCLGTKESYVSTGNVMYLTLQSHNTIPPFKLLVSQRNKVECSEGSRLATTAFQYITSPFYPGHYPNSMYCKWYISADSQYRIQIKINHLDLTNTVFTCDDYLRISDAVPTSSKICANSTGAGLSYITKYDWLTIEFNSNGSHAAKGFNISYKTFQSGGDCNQDFIVDLSPRYLNSTNYPSMYKRGFECVYRLNKDIYFGTDYSIAVSVVACDLPPRIYQQCIRDYVNVYDGSVKNNQDKVGTFCGDEDKFTVTAKSRSVLIDFVTSGIILGHYKGFQIKYMLERTTNTGNSGTCSVGRPLELPASSIAKYFTSPNYPDKYRNDQYCQWRITSDYKTIVFQVIDSDLGPKPIYDNEDNVKVYDGNDRYGDLLGKLYSTHAPTYLSSGSNLYIEFTSNSNGVYKGFKVKYYTMSYSVPEGSQSSDTSYGVMAGVISSITLLCIFICVCLCRFCMKRKTPPPRQSRSNSQRVVFNTSNSTVFVVPPVYDANNTSSPPPYSGVSSPEYNITAPYYPGNIPSVPPPAYSELPAYEDSAKYEIHETRSHPEPNPVPEQPQRQISRDDLRIRRNPQQFHVRRRNNSTQSIDSQEDLALVDEREVTGIDNTINHRNYSIPL
ncbi:cubilin isoform X1 [Patella vulgata]|uniref:cubilin isoform X1 n=1 Tax=Patella vulgata TaxID=6465 RepID=UPI0024A89674|nr:cubilin isoform X1 [Patella vulgata]